jgi:hypothetical protein
MEGTKVCSKCGVAKPPSDFAARNLSASILHGECKQCNNLREKEYRKKNRLYCQFKQLIKCSKARAKKKNLPHDLDIKYLRSIATEYCPYQNVKLRWADDSIDENFGTCSANSPSIDRIDDKKGYVRGNVVIVSHRANAIKRDATEQELIELGLRIAQFKMQLAIPE